MKHPRLSTIYLGLLLFIFGFIVLHAPFTVIMTTLFPTISDLGKSWKELLMVVGAILAAIIITKRRAWSMFVHDKLLWAIIVYCALHLLTILLLPQGVWATLAGLAIDLRYVTFFLLVYIALKLLPYARPFFVRVGAIGAAIVAGFATLQLFLPKDILTHIGYSKDTIAPYFTVDENHDYIRVNSTLRGPNPLGAYTAMALALVFSFIALQYHRLRSRLAYWVVGALVVCLIVALWISYSRSALLAAGFAVLVIILRVWGRKLKPAWWIVIGCALVTAAIGTITVVKDNSFVSNVILHENPAEGNDTNSNEGHVESLRYGVQAMISQPLGAGVGSTGTASYYGTSPLVIENQYLFIAHEVGWLGILLFLAIFAEVMRRVWMRRKDWLALGVFASGLGLAAIGLLLPVWVDDTVAIIWWGLAAVVIGGSSDRAINKASKRTT